MNYFIQHRRGTKEEWAAKGDIIPKEAEIVVELDEVNGNKFKIGDGITPYKDLPYATSDITENIVTKSEFDAVINELQEDSSQKLIPYIDSFEVSLSGTTLDLANGSYFLYGATAKVTTAYYAILNIENVTKVSLKVRRKGKRVSSFMNGFIDITDNLSVHGYPDKDSQGPNIIATTITDTGFKVGDFDEDSIEYGLFVYYIDPASRRELFVYKTISSSIPAYRPIYCFASNSNIPNIAEQTIIPQTAEFTKVTVAIDNDKPYAHIVTWEDTQITSSGIAVQAIKSDVDLGRTTLLGETIYSSGYTIGPIHASGTHTFVIS